MLDPYSVSIMPKPDGRVIAAGKSFANEPEARAWIARAIERRSKILGREIEDVSELVFGPKKRAGEPLTQLEKVAFAQFAVPMTPVERNDEPFAAHEDAPQSRKAALKQLHKEQLEAYQKRTGINAPAIPQEVVDARTYSFSLWEAVTFSENSTEAEVIKATQLKEVAFTDGADMDAWRNMASHFASAAADKHAQQVAAVNLERQQVEAKLASIQPPIKAPGAVPPGASVHRMFALKSGAVTYDVHDANRNVVASYPESEAPEHVKAAANIPKENQ